MYDFKFKFSSEPYVFSKAPSDTFKSRQLLFLKLKSGSGKIQFMGQYFNYIGNVYQKRMLICVLFIKYSTIMM